MHDSLSASFYKSAVKDVLIDTDTALPADSAAVGINADLLEHLDVSPYLERTDTDQIAEINPAFHAVIEAQPERVVIFRPALGQLAHALLLSVV